VEPSKEEQQQQQQLKGIMRLNLSKDMSVHVSTCTSSDSKPLNASCVQVVALIRRVSTSHHKIEVIGF
jgi:hypothetical protein